MNSKKPVSNTLLSLHFASDKFCQNIVKKCYKIEYHNDIVVVVILFFSALFMPFSWLSQLYHKI